MQLDKVKHFFASQTAKVTTVIVLTSLVAVASFAAQVYFLRATNDISSFPHPSFDTGIGIHWDASAQSNDITSAQNNVCALKEIGISWIKVAVNGDSTVDFVDVMKKNDIEPIVRIARPRMNPGRISASDLESIKEYVAVGASYFEINNEPNLRDEWNNLPLPCDNVAALTMDNWSKDAVVVQQNGGYPVFPGLAPTEDSDVSCEDGVFVRNSFNWLKNNQCQLADGTTGSCLDIFNADKSNGLPAVMSVHNYSLNKDQGGNIDGNEGFGLFRKYDGIVKEFLGRSIPILATEGGPTIADNSAPNNSPEAHKQIAIASANYQMNNTSPYFLNTAFWVSHLTGSVDPGARSQSWFDWSAGNKLKATDKFSQTINALKALQKKSRNGTPQPTGCSVGGTGPTPTVNPNNPSPTSSQCPTIPKTTPNPLACGQIPPSSSDNILKNGSFGGPNNDSSENRYANWTQFGDADFGNGGDNIDGSDVSISSAGNFRAGLYQTTTALTPGTWYHSFYATSQKVFGPGGSTDGALPIKREVGVDLSGGTDPNSQNIIWGRFSGGQPDKDAKRYGGWKTLENNNNPLVSFKATGRTATVFIKISGWPDVSRSDTWIDSAILTEACEDGNFDGTASPSCSPQASPTPTRTQANPTPSKTVPTSTPKPLPVGTCNVTLASVDESNTGYNLVKLNFSGRGGSEVILQMGQKGSAGKESGNAYNLNGFFSQNLVQALSPADKGKLSNQPPNEYGALGQFTSDVVYVNDVPADFKIYEWEKRFKKNPSVLNTSSNPSDFVTGKSVAWWYFLDYCDGKATTCTHNNITVKLPKGVSTYFFCSVRKQSPSIDLVCNGNPVCSYNDGPDISTPTKACNAWIQSCSTSDFAKYEPGIAGGGTQRGSGGINVDTFLTP